MRSRARSARGARFAAYQRARQATAESSGRKHDDRRSVAVKSSRLTATESQPAPAIVLTNVTKLFGRFAALRDISAEFSAGRLYLVLGDNGAGKSTLLRAIAGLMRPSRGDVTVLGFTGLRSVAAEIGYMAHAPLLYDELDGMENLRYFARLYGIRGDGRCAEVMRAVGLDPDLKRRIGQYSQGMRQRLSLARSILHDPAIVLLDEPFSNVDIVSAREMVRLLGEMRDAGKTVFVVTHQPALLDGVADESVIMNAGQIVARESARAEVPR
ncbi:MAG: ABC transporter ATP-binding protein [Terriglobales bacterium]